MPSRLRTITLAVWVAAASALLACQPEGPLEPEKFAKTPRMDGNQECNPQVQICEPPPGGANPDDPCFSNPSIWCADGSTIRQLDDDPVLGSTVGDDLEQTGVLAADYNGSGFGASYTADANAECWRPGDPTCIHVNGGFDNAAVGCPNAFVFDIEYGMHGREQVHAYQKISDSSWHGLAAAKYRAYIVIGAMSTKRLLL